MPQSIPLPLISVAADAPLPKSLSKVQRQWAESNDFAGQRGRLLALPGTGGMIDGYLFGVGAAADRPKLVTGLAAAALPPGEYALAGEIGDPTLAVLGFRLGAYRFDRYRK